MKKLCRIAGLFTVGGSLYLLVKMLCTMHVGNFMPYWATLLIGGVSFIFIGCINEWIPFELSLVKQSLIGTLVILLIEFTCGCILNLWLGLGICDYSDIPSGLYVQSRLQSIVGCFLLAGIAIVLDDYLRHLLLGGDKPSYEIIGNKEQKKEKTEFSKILVTWSLVLTTVCVALSYILSFTDHDPASDVTVSVSSACIAIAVAYEAKSFGEKNSRNKYGIDKNGYKIRSKENDDEDVVG